MARERLRIFKIGGKVVEDDEQLSSFLKAFALFKERKMLIHGGGKWVTEMCQRLGYEVNMIDGRRITDANTLEVVKMMLAGVANKNIVSKLQGFGSNAIGLTGADGNAILANKRPIKEGIDYGFVGDVNKINVKVINSLVRNDLVPVFAALTHDGKGQLFNTNADTIASAVAVGMSGDYDVELNYCFELNGVLEDIKAPNSVIPVINQSNYQDLKQNSTINAGMIPKIDNAFDALEAGVNAVRIMNSRQIEKLTQPEKLVGTLILKQ